MPEHKNDPHVLKQPKIGPQQEVSPEAAYLAAVTSLPRLMSDIGKVLAGILEELNGVHDKLDFIALYYERKGQSEGIWQPDDLLSADDDEAENEPES